MMDRNRPRDRALTALQTALKEKQQTFVPKKECCDFFMKGHTMYRGVYIPSKEEWVAHGYRAEWYDQKVVDMKADADAKSKAT